MGRDIGLILSVLIISGSILWMPPYSRAQGHSNHTCFAELVSLQGDVSIKKAGTLTWYSAKLHDSIGEGDIVRTGPNSRAALLISNDTVVRLGENTSIVISGQTAGHPPLLRLFQGVAHFFSRFPHSLKIITPFVNAAIEGTEFIISVDTEKTNITVFNGTVRASNRTGSIILKPNQTGIAYNEKAPTTRVSVSPTDAVKWALYYPSIFDLEQAPEHISKHGQELVEAVEAFRRGKVSRAIELLTQVDLGPEEAWKQVLIASMYLSVGQVKRAIIHLNISNGIRAGFGPCLALKSIIALTQNEKQKALELSAQAVADQPSSAASLIARSYALQAAFQPEKALETLREAVEAAPGNSLAWSRLSELYLCMGRLSEALVAARKAEALDPMNPHCLSVLGYALLARFQTDQAGKAFEKAIELGPAEPLPRLGLGLSMIKNGDLERGLVELEIAASLAPSNALIRSYLGKAYYAKCRDDKAETQFQMAKKLDPKDPTPWLYEAILKQSTNRPVEALEDLEESIALNDNRAVYRSRLLLDQDLGTRSTSLARIYNDLGFDQLAYLQGWKALDFDPGSYPAHRFLADSYSFLPRHEIARVSELLQSQLLQTLNITPVQPHLAESKHFFYTGTGPSLPSYNEYSPLFMSDRLSLQANGLLGTRGSWGDEVVQSGLYGRYSYSLGQFHYETNGFRENNDQHHNIYNAFVQSALSPSLNLQTEYRYTRIEKGDLFLRFDPGNFLPELRDDEKKNSLRIGLKYDFNPSSTLISSLILAETNWHTRIFPGYKIADEEEGFLAEIQHLYRQTRFSLVTGAGWFKTNQKISHSLYPIQEATNRDIIHQTDIYAYPRFRITDQCTLTAGASVDFYKGNVGRMDQFNPKFGLVWDITRDTTLRIAAFRVLKKMLLTDQTVEPTEVAGFNQFFDDCEGTKSWRYGVGLDHHIMPSLYGGVELSRRDLDVPYMQFGKEGIRYAHWREDLARAYLYWIATKQAVATAEYQYEKFDRTDYQPGEEDIVCLETHRLPLSVGLFLPIGFGARFNATAVWQSGIFGNRQYGTYYGRDHFWVLDLSIRYRLPKRYGMIELEGKNLLDHHFSFQDTDPSNPTICPKRFIFTRITFWF